MRIQRFTYTALLGLLSVAPALAQQGSEVSPNPCTVTPIYHCAEPTQDGGYIAHFGYGALCDYSDKPVEEIFIQIGDDNFFSPEPVDRGQPKIFVAGEHVDEFEVEFTAREVEKGDPISWTVLQTTVHVDFAKTKDDSLDCAYLGY